MARRVEPSNEACLAAELVLACPVKITPYGAARTAAELCALGRRFKRLSESLCNYPDPGDRRARARDKVSRAIDEALKGFRATADSSGGGLIVVVETTHGTGRGTRTERTALL